MCEDAGSAKTKNEWEAGDRSYRKNSASLSHFRADGIMRPGQEQQPWRSVFCAPPPCYKYNVTTSRTRLSLSGMHQLPVSFLSAPPPFHPKIISHITWLRVGSLTVQVLCFALRIGISHNEPWGLPYSLIPLSSLLPVGPIPMRRREKVQVCSITKMTPFTLADMNGAEVLA